MNHEEEYEEVNISEYIQRNSFIFYHANKQYFQIMTGEQCKILILALIDFSKSFGSIVPDFSDDALLQISFHAISQAMLIDMKKYIKTQKKSLNSISDANRKESLQKQYDEMMLPVLNHVISMIGDTHSKNELESSLNENKRLISKPQSSNSVYVNGYAHVSGYENVHGDVHDSVNANESVCVNGEEHGNENDDDSKEEEREEQEFKISFTDFKDTFKSYAKSKEKRISEKKITSLYKECKKNDFRTYIQDIVQYIEKS